MHFQTQVLQVDPEYLSVYHLSTDPCLWTALPRKQTVFGTRRIKKYYMVMESCMLFNDLFTFIRIC